MSRYNIVVFGFTGYTGKFVFEEVYRQSKKENLTFAVAGRDADKIRKGLEESAVYLEDEDVKKTPIIIANVSDKISLNNMTKQANVVLNCVGPYRFYGENVVKSCIENGADHLDISGEPQFLEGMQLRHHEEAAKNEVYVIGSCGFDSIPPEVGIKYLSDQFQGALNDVEYYVANKMSKNMKVHTGTWESLVHGFANRKDLSAIRKQLFHERIPKPKYVQEKRSLVFYSNEIKRWCLPFLGSDKSVVSRSQHYLHFQKGLKPVQFNPFIGMSSIFQTIFLILLGGIIGLFSSFRFGRYLLLTFPRLFSFGLISPEGASRKALEDSKMQLVLIGKGWSSSSSVDTEKPNRKIICSINGPEPGYLSCSIFLVQAAITILKEREKMPRNGGVYPPLVAFYDTTYLDRLQNNDIHFANVSDNVIR